MSQGLSRRILGRAPGGARGGGGSPVVTGDRMRFPEVVRHLLGNAVTDLGDQPAPRVEVGRRTGNGSSDDVGGPRRMLKVVFFVSTLLLAPLLWAQAGGEKQADPGELEARLAAATGREKLELLAELADAYRRSDPAKAIAFGTEALELLQAIPDQNRKLEILNSLAVASIQQREFQRALGPGMRAERLAREMNHRPALALALQNVGEAYRVLNDFERSFEKFAEAARLYEEIGDLAGLGRTLYLTGISYRLMSDYSQALEYQVRAHRACEQAGFRWGMAAALNDIGLTYEELGQYSKALDSYQKVLDILEEEGDEASAARVQNNIGNLYRAQGEPALALEYYRRSLKIKEEHDDKYGIANALCDIGMAYQDLGDLDRALELYRRALEMKEADGYKKGMVRTLRRIASAHQQKGKPLPAVETLQGALAIASDINARGDVQSIYRELSEVYAGMGRFEEALEAFRQHETIRSEIFNEENSRTIAEMQTRFETEQIQKEIELLQQQQSLQALELDHQLDTRRALVAGFGLVVLILVLVFNRFRLKARAALMAETVKQERAVSARLRELDQLKDDFLATTSHELRTPLYAITGLAESLIDGARGKLPEPVNSDLAMLVASGRRLSRLINDILDYSRITHKSLKLKKRPVDLRPLADVVLVANAIKFTEQGKVEVTARAGSPAEEDQLVVIVSDTGIGIAEEKIGQVFEAFEQGDSSVHRAFGGTGLGLTVTRELVELHGGRMGVESTLGQGTRFFFTLPISRDPRRACDRQTEEVAPVAQQPVSRPLAIAAAAVTPPPQLGRLAEGAPSPGTARILIVDDEPVILQVLSNHLGSAGYEVALATNGPEALRLVDERAFDLVVLDVMMPKMSGYEVCRTLRERHSLQELPVIFLTAKNQVPDLVVALAAGGNDYLAKPIGKDELLARVRTHLELGTVHRDLARRNAELARFNYTVAHDLRNPLVTIKNFLGVVRRDAASGRFKRLEGDLECLDAAADRLQRLLEELFALSRVGVETHPPEEVPLAELVRTALGELSEAIAERGVAVEVVADLPVVTGDRARLLEVVRHLLANAVTYLGDQPAPRVEVGVRHQGAEPLFYVRDNGRGIDPRYHEKIFGLFERLDPEAAEGTGIGLALVRRIVEVHGGQPVRLEGDLVDLVGGNLLDVTAEKPEMSVLKRADPASPEEPYPEILTAELFDRHRQDRLRRRIRRVMHAHSRGRGLDHGKPTRGAGVEPFPAHRQGVDPFAGEALGPGEPPPAMAVPETEPLTGADRDHGHAEVLGDGEAEDVGGLRAPRARIGKRRPSVAVEVARVRGKGGRKRPQGARLVDLDLEVAQKRQTVVHGVGRPASSVVDRDAGPGREPHPPGLILGDAADRVARETVLVRIVANQVTLGVERAGSKEQKHDQRAHSSRATHDSILPSPFVRRRRGARGSKSACRCSRPCRPRGNAPDRLAEHAPSSRRCAVAGPPASAIESRGWPPAHPSPASRRP